MITTQLNANDQLPLTCTREGTCCHGKNVFLNPWELKSLAKEENITTQEFRDTYCEFGGIRLRFDGPVKKVGKIRILVVSISKILVVVFIRDAH